LSKLDTSVGGLILDVAIIGAGFGGLYCLYKFREEMGLKVASFDDASGVGGTWFWNRYPGCRTDTQAMVYSYSFDRDMVQQWNWSERYPRQPEVLAYLNAVADKHDLKRSINFNTRIVSARWSEAETLWVLETGHGVEIRARFLIEGVGLLSSTNVPNFKGIESFKGEIFHAARWPEQKVDLVGKRVAVVGTGSTGIQLIADLAPEVEHLYVYQRTPQYVVPSQNGPVPAKTMDWVRRDYDGYHAWVMNSATVFGLNESSTPAMSVSADERARVYQDAWNEGGGFGFMLATFGDIITDRAANQSATDFIRAKIRGLVNDPALAEALCPTDLYAKRPLCTDNYYETYNRNNVTLVNLKNAPIEKVTEHGIRTATGEIELDVIVFATGFDAFTGNYLKIETVGRGGERLQDKWSDGPRSYMGVATAGFPNLFMIYGPFGPFTSQPLVHEFQINWFAEAIKYVLDNELRTIEVRRDAEDAWIESCNEIASQTLFAETDSWINGGNIPGKPRKTMVYMGGMNTYADIINGISASGYPDFILT
jgi:cyclohexanone monooxygenase